MDAQVSLARILVGDNKAPFTYTDAEIRAAVSIGPTRPAFPADLRMCALLAFIRFPVTP